MLKARNLRISFFLAILIGLAIPFLISAVYLSTRFHSHLLEEYEKSQQQRGNVLADALAEPLWFHRKSQAQRLIDRYAQFPEILEVVLHDGMEPSNTFVKNSFQKKSLPECTQSERLNFVIPVTVVQKNFSEKLIGTLTLAVSTCPLQTALQSSLTLLLVTIILQYLISIFLLVWLLNIRVIRPANLLMRQSKMNDMAKMFVNISHQWRQPLAELANYQIHLETLIRSKEQPDKERQLKLLKSSNNLLQHLSQTIDTFYHLHKPDQEKTVFEAGEALRQVFSLLESPCRQQNVALKQDIPTILLVEGYYNDLVQILINLFSNALESHHHRGTEQRWIKASVQSDGNDVLLSVEDNAGGIKAYPIERVFEPYYTDKPEGTGIGLYLARTLITEMGGTIEASNTSVGAKFTIRLSKFQ